MPSHLNFNNLRSKNSKPCEWGAWYADPKLPEAPHKGSLTSRQGVVKVAKTGVNPKWHPATLYQLHGKWKVWEFHCSCPGRDKEIQEVSFTETPNCKG